MPPGWNWIWGGAAWAATAMSKRADVQAIFTRLPPSVTRKVYGP
jgi:hypothetical protein